MVIRERVSKSMLVIIIISPTIWSYGFIYGNRPFDDIIGPIGLTSPIGAQPYHETIVLTRNTSYD